MALPFPHLDEALNRRLLALGVRPADVEERFVRGTGPGGQKINKTSSTVALRHAPSGVEVRCQSGRSQADNRETAWRELADRLEQARVAARAAQIDARERERRRNRPKSRRQKALQVESKRRRARTKGARGRVASSE